MARSKEFSPRVRELILERDLGRCGRCGRWFGDALNIHHRRLRSQGGMGVPENGISLCGSGTTRCHGIVHKHVAESRERGMIVPSWDDPAEAPIHTWRGVLRLDSSGGFETLSPPRSLGHPSGP